MTVKELMAKLKKANPKAIVKLSIGDPKDSAFTNEILRVDVKKNSVEKAYRSFSSVLARISIRNH